MRLNYTVLCVDDRIRSLADTKRELFRHNETVGVYTDFLDVEVSQGPRETDLDAFRTRIFHKINSYFESHQIDLVIVDLHLGQLKGHEVIEHIRDSQTMYRPIVFYSGGEPEGEATAESQLQDGLKENNLVGKSVFLSVRGDNLIRDLRGICSEMHNEEHKLNASRGLLMDQTSEIDAKTISYLKSVNIQKVLSEEQQSELQKALKNEIKRQKKNADKKSKLLGPLSEQTLDEIWAWMAKANPTDMDAMGWNKFLRALLKTRPELSDVAKIHFGYFNQVEGSPPSISAIRNQYAHQTAEQIGASHDDSRCKLIRDELRKHLKNIELVTKAE